MSTVEHLRQTQTDIRLISGKLGELKSEQQADHRRAVPGDPFEKAQAWSKIKGVYNRRREVLKLRLNDLETERGELERKLNQTPLTKATLSHVISQLTDVESQFAIDGPDSAWDKLSAFIDWLEREDNRVNVESQVAKLESVAA